MKEKIIEYIKENSRETAIVTAITIFALIMRLILVQNYGDLWLDELYSWYFANQKNVFMTFWELVRQDLHMPLYFIILHFWIKIFGQSDTSMHLCTLALTLPLVPISYYTMKSLFNKTTGYFAAIMFAINTFCIYYSVEVRFYGLVFVLALLSAFLFVKMLDGFDKKYTITFIIAHSLLIYTFSITPLLTLFYGVVGILYIFTKKRELLKDFCKTFGLIFCIALPSAIFTIYNYIVMKSTLCSFNKDIYIFSWNVIYDILENFFTSENFQIITLATNSYRNVFASMNDPIYAIFVAIPVVIGVLGVIKALFVKNEKLKLFLLPSLLFLICMLIFGAMGINSFLTRYATIIYPVIVCAACFGLSQFRVKPVTISIFALFVVLNYIYLFVSPNNIFNTPRKGLKNLTAVMTEMIKPSNEDLILIPYSGSKVMRYIPQGKFIEFNADDALLLKDKASQEFYFSADFYKMLSRSNVKSLLRPNIYRDEPFENYETNLKSLYFDKMKKGQKFIVVSYRNSFTMPLMQSWENLKIDNNYYNMNTFILLMSKITKDSVQICNENLKFLNEYTDMEGDYTIFVFEK